ncbi:uncharacterized protein LOC144478025, partial [Augochlora pura]
NFIIGGDFNAKHTSWNNYTSNSSGISLFNHSSSAPYLINHPGNFTFCPTNIKESKSTLDIFLTKHHYTFHSITTDDFTTRHRPVLLTSTPSTLPPPHMSPNIDWAAYNNHTNNFKLTTTFQSTAHIDSTIINLQAYLLACTRKRHGLSYHKDLVKLLSAQITSRIARIRSNAWDKKIRKQTKPDPTFWANHRTLTGKKFFIPPLSHNNITLTSDLAKANHLCRTFQNVHNSSSNTPSIFDTKITHFTSKALYSDALSDPPTTSNFHIPLPLVRKAIITQRSNKSPGYDHITPPMLKNASPRIALQLYYIFNHSIKFHYFPNKWKIARIVPIPKPGKDHKTAENY